MLHTEIHDQPVSCNHTLFSIILYFSLVLDAIYISDKIYELRQITGTRNGHLESINFTTCVFKIHKHHPSQEDIILGACHETPIGLLLGKK